jgi:hypothetical protein
MHTRRILLVTALVLAAGTETAMAGAQLQRFYDCTGQTHTADGCQTVVFIHGKGDCSTGMSDCNGGDATTGPNAYWTNRSNNLTMLDESTTKYYSDGTFQYFEAISLGYDLKNQGFWSSAADVGNCLTDLHNGTNTSGCNPNLYQRSTFYIDTHSAGATVLDRLLSTNWYSTRSYVRGTPNVVSPALVGSKAASTLYGDGLGSGSLCSSFVSWIAGWFIKDNGTASLTKSTVIAEAAKGYAGKSPITMYKIVTTGGSGSANNNWTTSVDEHDNDSSMGALAGCMGSSSSDDMDGLLYWSDEDPTSANPATGGAGCPAGDHSCHTYAGWTGSYRHWIESWANHSHTRDDAYTTLGDRATATTCVYRSPGTCLGQFGQY